MKTKTGMHAYGYVSMATKIQFPLLFLKSPRPHLAVTLEDTIVEKLINGQHFQTIFLNTLIVIDICLIEYVRNLPQLSLKYLLDNPLTLIQVMAWCIHQTSVGTRPGVKHKSLAKSILIQFEPYGVEAQNDLKLYKRLFWDEIRIHILDPIKPCSILVKYSCVVLRFGYILDLCNLFIPYVCHIGTGACPSASEATRKWCV